MQSAQPMPATSDSWWQRHSLLIVLLTFAFMAATALSGLSYVWRLQITLVWKGSCSAIGLTDDDLGGVTINCNGTRYDIRSPVLAISYAINPGPITCSIYANGQISCEKRPFK